MNISPRILLLACASTFVLVCARNVCRGVDGDWSHSGICEDASPAEAGARPDEVDDCGGEISLGNPHPPKGLLTSPGFPVKYPSDAACLWSFTAPAAHQIRLVVREAYIEESSDCMYVSGRSPPRRLGEMYDYLEILDGGDTNGVSVGRLCGVLQKRTFISSANQMSLVFASDINFEDKGFVVEYGLHAPNKSECNQTILAREGYVTSPRFPRSYPENSDCWIQISMPSLTDRMTIQFEFLSLEYSPGCTFDFVEIQDGISAESDVLGRFCRDLPDGPVVTSGNQALIRFRSDHLLNGRGFKAKFKAIDEHLVPEDISHGPCQWEDKGNGSGTVTSPNFPENYNANSKCTMILRAPIGQRLRLIFQLVDLEHDELCMFDSVEVRDGNSADGRVLGKFCGRMPPGTTVTSSSDTMSIFFSSDEFAEFQGFSASYEIIEEESGEPELTEMKLEGSDQWKLSTDPTLPVLTVVPQNATVLEGSPHVINCKTNMSDIPTVWLKDQTIISDSESAIPGLHLLPNDSLLITEMTLALKGVYTCVILSVNGALVSNAWIEIDPIEDQDLCDVEFQQKPTDVSLVEGSHNFLACFAENAVIEWFRDDTPIAHGVTGRIQALVNGFLLINRAQANDTGMYTCLARSIVSGCVVSVEIEVLVTPKPNVEAVCGQPVESEPDLEKPRMRKGKIIAGHSASKGSFPWQAMLWELWAGSFCGGTLINEEWVVTAAHCFTEFQDRFSRPLKISSLVVKLGKTDQTRPELEEEVIGVKRVVLHNSFNKTVYDNDIALVQLAKKIWFTDHIIPICLGTSELLHSQVYRQPMMGTVTGWGLIAENGNWPVKLQEIRLPIVDHEDCVESTSFVVTENMFCAGYDRQVIGDACQGDSGGPFSVKLRDRWYLAGLVSWGEGCDRVGKFGFYTKVGNYLHWIRKMIMS